MRYDISIVGGARGVMVIVGRNGHGDHSSNSRLRFVHFR